MAVWGVCSSWRIQNITMWMSNMSSPLKDWVSLNDINYKTSNGIFVSPNLATTFFYLLHQLHNCDQHRHMYNFVLANDWSVFFWPSNKNENGFQVPKWWLTLTPINLADFCETVINIIKSLDMHCKIVNTGKPLDMHSNNTLGYSLQNLE